MKKTIVFILISLALLSLPCLSPQPANASALSDLANSLQPGEWRELVTNNFNGGQILTTPGRPGTGNILEYTDEAQWDPVGKKLYIIGTALPYGVENQKWVEYSESTNSWREMTNPSFYIGVHSYDHAALDSSRGQYYVRTAASSMVEVYRYSFATGQWTQLPDMPYSYSNPSALEYFPEIDRVVYVETYQSKFFLFNPSTNAWTEQAWGITGAGYDIHNITEYDPVNGVLYFGGGNYNPYEFCKLDRTGKVTKLATPPVALGISGYCANHTVDPVSGKFLVFKPDGNTYEYNPAINSWRTAGTHPLSNSEGKQIAVSAKIPEYGVIMAVSFTDYVGKVYLYKHSSSTPPPSDTQSPTTPSNLSATAVSSSQINLSWSASTDNVGVTGYRLERCQGSTCTNFSQISTPTAISYSDTSLSANTTYRYQIRAQDAAGNLSGYSSIASATTFAGGGVTTGLDFPSNGSGTVQFRFTGANLVNAWPATYIWRVKPRQQTGYYTTFFWGHMSAGSMADFQYNYYGAHPYPQGGSSGTSHNWEISINGGDLIVDQNGYNTTVVKDRWYTQALTAERIGQNDVRVTFYWDLEAGTNRVIQTTQYGYALNFPPTNPGLVFGDAPWSPGNELLSGILRGIQIYNTNLSLSDIQSEANNPLSTSAGTSNIWYLNTNPTPTDISDKSGKGHNPSWFGSNRPTLYTSGGSSDTTAPTVSITAPANGSTVSGPSVAVSANASDNVGVSGVQFKLDGANLGSEDIISTYSITWNTTLTANGSHTLTATARDAAGNSTTSSAVSVTVDNTTPTPDQINIPLKQWIAIQTPEYGKGVYYGDTIYDGQKHVNAALNPLNGRIYFTGGDYSGPVYGQSYRQETYSLSLVERWNDKANRNAGWRLEYPYCGPSGQVQPKHPDAHGWAWDSKRNIFWHVPPLDYYSNDNCPGETDSGGSDPGFIRSHLMAFDPATQNWTDRGATGGSLTVGRGAEYDPVTDSIIHLIEGEVEIYDITNNKWTKYPLGQNVNGGTIYFNIALSAIDLNRRVVYAIDYNSGRLYQYKVDAHTLEDLGLVPGGPTGFVETYIAYDSVSDVLYWFDYPREVFNIYHPNTKTWETNVSRQSDIAGVDIRARGLVFDELQNVLVAYGDSASSPQPYFFLYRYGSGTTLKGDVNSDSSVDSIDLQALVNHILGSQDYGSSADVNSDGSVDALDVQEVVNIILGG